MKSTGVHGTVPNAASGSVYPLYPTGANWQTSVYSLRVFDAGNNYIVNPSWAEIGYIKVMLISTSAIFLSPLRVQHIGLILSYLIHNIIS